MEYTKTLAKRFWAKVDMSRGLFACWTWKGAHSKKRRGVRRPHIRLGGRGTKMVSAARVALFLQTGDWGDGREPLHSCDNPGCINPSHLGYGTHQENMHDHLTRYRTVAGKEVIYEDEIPF